MRGEDQGRWAVQAEQAFWRARRAADREVVVCRLRRQPVTLLSFDPIARQLRLHNCRERGLQEIPLDRIVGSLGKAEEFTRAFRPRSHHLKERWKQIYKLAQSFRGPPPIEVYQVGDAYFVKDGHHRVSVARVLGATHIEAYVTEYLCPVPVKTAMLDKLAAGQPALAVTA